MLSFTDSTNVSFINATESCPVPGCGKESAVMEGTFSFLANETLVHDAPAWSVHALTTLQTAIAEAMNLAANTETTDQEVKVAFEKAASLTRINSQNAPIGIRSQLIEMLSLRPVMKVKGFKRRVLVAGFVLHLILTNYGAYKSSVTEIINDSANAIEWAAEHIGTLNQDLQSQVKEILDELKNQ